MKRLIVFIGKAGSGKTTLISELVKRYPDKFKKLITCTSRTPRIGEIDGKDYHFLSPDFFINNEGLVLIKKTDDGLFYGTRINDLHSTTDQHRLLTSGITGIPKLVKLGISNIVVVRISIDEDLKIQRMQQRGDTEEMISKRLKLDTHPGMDIKLEGIPIINLDANQTIDQELEIILRHIDRY